jgi:hypothetical protein
VILDCPTRWSSTHAMLSRFEELRNDVDAFLAGQIEFKDAVPTTPLSGGDWLYVRCMSKLLQPFADDESTVW